MARVGIDRRSREHRLLWDVLFILLFAFYAWASYLGQVALSGHGADLDSDLSSYAATMSARAHPENFVNDAVLHEPSEAADFWTLEGFLAHALSPEGDFALGFLRAGALAFFCHYLFAYVLGRRLFTSPFAACLVALVLGIPIWIEWGTFWGVSFSSPTPRVFYAALWPLLLLAGMAAYDCAWGRPAVMLLAGLGIWVHAISALNVGTMFFVAFALHRPRQRQWGSHISVLACSLVLFFAPVLPYLWPSLVTGKPPLGHEELEILRQLFSIRWAEDYGNLAGRLIHLVSPEEPFFAITLAGLLCWPVVRFGSDGLPKVLARMCPAFVLALLLVVGFSWLEGEFAQSFGRLPMAHELVRGLRFCLPLSLLLCCGVVSVLARHLGELLGKALLVATLVGCLSVFTLYCRDTGHVAALYTLFGESGISLPMPWDYGEHVARMGLHARNHRDALDKVAQHVPPDNVVFSNDGDNAVRYHSLRALAHTFKDGSTIFYNRRVDQARKWLELQAMLDASPTGYITVWKKLDIPWLLSNRPEDRANLSAQGEIVWENAGWILLRQR